VTGIAEATIDPQNAETQRRRPAIVAVDDEPAVLAAVARDLRRGFGERYRIMRASSGAEGLDLLKQVRARGEQVALLVADQRMPGLSGTDYLVKAREVVPEAKRVLLTAYADTEAAIQAINEVALDYYLLKPWDPPEEQLFPVVEDLLTTWEAGAALESGGVRVIGHRFSKDTHDVRDFLARNRVPARWLDIERDGEARELLAVIDADPERLPVAVLEDGGVLERPTTLELAERLGISAQPVGDHYDLVIVGGGPAGLAAAVYGASEGLGTIVVEREAPGGQAGTSSRIENYLGFPSGVSGDELAGRALKQARRLGAEILVTRTIEGIDAGTREVRLDGGDVLRARTVILACGVSWRRLEIEGFDRLAGKGISYGAARSEAANTHGLDVQIVGAGNSAGQAAIFFSNHARRVTILCRSEGLEKSMSRYLIDQLATRSNIEVLCSTEVVAAHGEEVLEEIEIRDNAANEITRLESGGLFIFIGADAETGWLPPEIALDRRGFVLTGSELTTAGHWELDRDPYLLETSVPGIFACGDVRSGPVKRVASAVGEGSMAIAFVHQYLREAGGRPLVRD
jgi:thioredoxin reductase (NADPH)